MSLEISYRELIIRQLLLDYLYNGIIPTPDQLEEDLESYQTNEGHIDLNLPKVKYNHFSIEKGDYSSASNLESFKNDISMDSMAITKEIYKLAKTNNQYYERWLSEVKRLQVKASRLEDRMDSLLLLANNTEGYFGIVEDNFSSLDFIDTENTTAAVNVDEYKVGLNAGSTLGTITQINTEELSAKDILFSPLNRKASTYYYNTSTNNTLLKTLQTNNSTWVGKIISSASGPMTAELKIRISYTDNIELSKIFISAASPNISNNATITAQYSEDGYNWFIVPTTEATKPFNKIISWNFKTVNAKWVKFIIYKARHDSGNFEYLYSISNIKFFNNAYHKTRGNLLYSSSLSALDKENNEIGFFKAELTTCEFLPKGTSISYSLSASKDNSTWTDWYNIVPFDSNNTQYPKIVNFSGIEHHNNTSSNVETFNTSYDADNLVLSITDTDVQHRFAEKNIGIINTRIDIPDDIETSLLSNTIEVWRDIRVQSSYPDTLKVRDIVRGWNFEGQIYSCYFEVISSEGIIINFGDKECIIDGEKHTGTVNIAEGIHKFSTVADNWFDISNKITENIPGEEFLKSIDPLYPYNHKLLIEGIPYSSGFEGERKYIGTDFSAAYYCKRDSFFNIRSTSSLYNSFVVKNIGISSDVLGVFIQYDQNNTDYINERFLVRWKQNSSSSGSYKYIKICAEFDTDDTSVSPELTGYRIKLGI